MRFVIIAAMLLIVIPLAAAQSGHIRLLALTESGNETSGSVADLYLELMPGKERVFLETFPLTKVSTQISMRFAQQIACKELDVECADKDFFFTIKALPGIVGGPSAGGAATVLAAALLKNLTLRDDVAMTGTINSGGIIGPVGGVKEKIEAAANSGVRTVLIPKGVTGVSSSEKDNETLEIEDIDLVAFGKELGITVVEVTTFAEALEQFTGYKVPEPDGSFSIDARYQATMKDVATLLCNRVKEQQVQITNNETKERVANLTRYAQETFDSEAYYASASYCFRTNVLLRQEQFRAKNMSMEEFLVDVRGLREQLKDFEAKTDARQIETITDLQTLMLVKERILEAEDILHDAFDSNETQERADALAYAQERLESAKTWALFFSGKDHRFVVDEERLKASCEAKIAEAEERHNYVTTYLPEPLQDTRKAIDQAYALMQKKEYALCLHQASKAKAESDAILGLLGVDEEDINDLLERKLGIVNKALLKAQQKGIFPLIGYSYYEYANSLKKTDRGTAILFVDYALEFSNLDIYFEEKTKQKVPIPEQTEAPTEEPVVLQPLFFAIALLAGILIGMSYTYYLMKKASSAQIQTRARPRRALRGKKR